MERADRAPVGTFHAPGPWSAALELGASAAHHASVKRLKAGDVVRVTSGDGRRAQATIAALGKRQLVVALDETSVEVSPPPPHVELWAPVGDRERMLLLAEKATELGASVWRPIVYRRSLSVSPRGEGGAFQEKVRLRMIGALEQSGGAWLPAAVGEMTLDEALREAGSLAGVLLDAGGEPLRAMLELVAPPIGIALGPEGGFEPGERASFLASGWRPASLGANVLRFETAGIAALALVRSFTP